MLSTMMELWSLNGHLVEEEGAGEDVVVEEEEVTVLLNLTMKLSKMEGTMDTMLLNSTVSMMMEVWIMNVEEVAGEEEDAVVVVEEEVTTVINLTMKLNKLEETMVTPPLLQENMGMMMEV